MPAEWMIDHWPVCGFHAFLSHVKEDRDSLVLPVLEKLQANRVISWIDQHHYPAGLDSHEALRDSILQCRHIIYFITPSMLKQGRGWTAIESAYSDVVQRQLYLRSSTLMQFELPLFFIPNSHKGLERTAWRRFIDRGVFYRTGRKANVHTQVDWAVDEVTRFVRDAERRADEVAGRMEYDQELKDRCLRDPNFSDRLLATSPVRFPW